MMRKFCFKFLEILCLILILCSFLFFRSSSDQPVYAAQNPEVIHYQVDGNYPPFTYSNENRIYGFDPDFTNLLFRSTDYNVTYSYDNWPKVYNRIVNGEIDIAGIIAVTDERKKEVLFTDSLFSSSVSVYTRTDYPSITFTDLQDLTLGVGTGYYTEELLKNTVKHNQYISYDNLNQAIDDLESGKIDAIFEDRWLIDSLLVFRKDKGAFTAQITELYPLPHAYAVNKNRPELVSYMNKRIAELKKSGIFEEIYTKYFYTHSDYYLVANRNHTILLLSCIAIGILFIFLLLKIYIDLLKRRISSHYQKLEETNQKLFAAHDELQSQYEEIQAQYEEIQAQYEEIELSQNELTKSEERYRLITTAANDGLWDWDMISDTLFISEKWALKIGFQNSTVNDLSKNWRNYIEISDDTTFLNKLRDFWRHDLLHFSEEISISFSGSEYHWYLIKASVVRSKDSIPLRMAGTISDINKQKQHDAQIYQLAYYDHLTKLPNRLLLTERLNQILANVIKENHKAALYYIDLDNFKHINDTLGHAFGDQLLVAVAYKLQLLVSNHLYVFRAGGDEFIVVADCLSSSQNELYWANYLQDLFQREWTLPEGDVYLSASIGITLIPDNGIDIHKILQSADAAMYEAKEEGKGIYKIFHEDMLKRVSLRSEMEIWLRKAIENKSFQLHYQPYYQIADRKLIGMEALIRWNHPIKGNIPPSDFIPIAEESGLIREIGKWVLETACAQNKLWQTKGYEKVPIAVNVSEIQLEDKNFIPNLKQILYNTQLDPQYLHIEVTESCIMKFLDKYIELLKEIQDMGISISLDDFGTGYSSLNYLQNLPIDTVKIDKSFIDEILKRSPDTLILSEIISIAHKLHMTVIAEGLEELEQVEYLSTQKCDYMQGYYMNKPMPVEQIEKLLSDKLLSKKAEK